MTLGCNPANVAAALGTATATDACGTVTNITSSDGAVISNGCLRSQTRTFTATDACNNSIYYNKNCYMDRRSYTASIYRIYADVTLGCNPANADASLGTATATDACGTVTNITSSDAAVISNGCLRSQTRTFTATDACNNSIYYNKNCKMDRRSYTSSIYRIYADVPLGCNPANPDASLGTATATDACGTVTNITSSDAAVISNGCLRSQTRTFIATDACNNSINDNKNCKMDRRSYTASIYRSYADVTLGCNPANPDASLGTATATDACGTVTNITSSDGAVISNGCLRSQTRTFTATDACNNSISTTRTVTWTEDLTPPVFTGTILM